MTDVAVNIQQPIARFNASKHDAQRRISGKVRVAIDAMVWDGLPRGDAAAKAGISDHGLYKALRSAPVKAYYLAELEVLRTSERARNIHALADVRDGDNQMARVAAVKALEQLSDESIAQSRGSVALPGLTIQIINAPSLTSAPVAPILDRIDNQEISDT